MSAPYDVEARVGWFREKLNELSGLPHDEAVKVLDRQLMNGVLTLRGVKIFLAALKPCPHNCQGEGGIFLVFKGLSVLEGGHYCDPEEALANWEAHVQSPADDDVVLKYL